MKKRALALLCIVLAFAGLLTGCGFMAASELLTLPAQPSEYAALQSAINQVITAGAEYSSPVSGSRRQSVQMADIDADGNQEAIAFFKTAEEKPLKVCIFKQDGEKWKIAAEITGDGSAFDSVEFIRLTKESTYFLAIGWQIGGDFTCAMSVYSLKDLKPVEIGSFNYDEYRVYDADGDTASEILAVTASSNESKGVVSLYKYTGSGVENISQAELTTGAGSVMVVKTGYLKNYTPALFVMSTFEYGYITDIISCVDGELKNLVMNPVTSRASTFVTKYYYARDINNDMITEVPIPRQLKSSEMLTTSTNRFMLQWYSIDAIGRRTLTMTTYQNDNDGWYMDFSDLDYDIVANTPETGGGESAVTFYHMAESGEVTEILSVYTLTGDNRYSRATVGRRFMIMENGDKVYAARLPQSDNIQALEEARQEIIERFHLLTYDWDTGEVS